LEAVDKERADCEETERKVRSELSSVERGLRELDERRRELVAREPEWREYDARAVKLGAYLDARISDRASLDAARIALATKLATTRNTEETLRDSHERLVREARELIAAGGPFEPDLLLVKDQLEADLVAANFEDVGLDDAGVVEARLGPLTQALVVDSPHSAARELRDRPDTLADVLLVSRETNLEELASAAPPEEGSSDVLVEEGPALRLSRIPVRPRLGRRAREARAAEIRALAEAKASELEEVRATDAYWSAWSQTERRCWRATRCGSPATRRRSSSRYSVS